MNTEITLYRPGVRLRYKHNNHKVFWNSVQWHIDYGRFQNKMVSIEVRNRDELKRKYRI